VKYSASWGNDGDRAVSASRMQSTCHSYRAITALSDRASQYYTDHSVLW